MPPKGFCPAHGPYNGTACPYPPPHSDGDQWRPSAPTPLNDDLPTDLGANYGSGVSSIPLQNELDENEASTVVSKPSAQRKILNYDEDETELGRSAREDVTELEVTAKTTLCMLWIKEGPRRGRFYPVHHGTVIGRKNGDLILDDPKVSSSHAKFTVEGEQFFLWDFASSNGTYVNGKKIRKATLLTENDIIKIGETLFVVKLLESKSSSKQKSPSSIKSRKTLRSKNI